MAVFTLVVATLILCDFKEYKKSKSDTFFYLALAIAVLAGAGFYYG
jgi:hypothetical protein